MILYVWDSSIYTQEPSGSLPITVAATLARLTKPETGADRSQHAPCPWTAGALHRRQYYRNPGSKFVSETASAPTTDESQLITNEDSRTALEVFGCHIRNAFVRNNAVITIGGLFQFGLLTCN
ncbi:hypothetical protein ACRALDRAFT_2032185 [Sodiomyces alcalophilus JCM 7366]|uniref:uncharacterized protein n=1 Tax=Sodiomyces alcalophilus JCM 7366 TaxID=591952 RepID=UPI0039B4D33F